MCTIIRSYLDLETINLKWKTKCIFGAGEIGAGEGYEILSAAGCSISFYVDNNLSSKNNRINGLRVKPFEYLLDNSKGVFVFVCVGVKYKREIEDLFSMNEINEYAFINYNTIAQVLDSVDLADESVKRRYRNVYDDSLYLQRQFKKKIGYNLNLDNPESFNEKLQWLKIHDHNPKYTSLVDKHLFKKYIIDKFGSQYIIPEIGLWDRIEDIDYSDLPQSFVLKCTHDSGSIVVVPDKNKIKPECIMDTLKERLNTNYYWRGREWPYKNVSRRIIAEEYVDSEMIDYKFICFNGEPKLVFTCTERFEEGLKVTFFDMSWNRLPFTRHYPASKKHIAPPDGFSEMIKMAREVSEGIRLVRVDFYEIDGSIKFGELTFFPGGGLEEFSPQDWDYKLGNWINLNTVANMV